GSIDRAGVRATLARSAAVVMPSPVEPFGMVALEAMAAGRAAVASAVSGAAEFVQGGILVDPADPVALAAAVRQALAQPELGLQGRAAAAAYDWNLICPRYVAIYSRVGR